jgi:hypothetical protein
LELEFGGAVLCFSSHGSAIAVDFVWLVGGVVVGHEIGGIVVGVEYCSWGFDLFLWADGVGLIVEFAGGLCL